MTAFIRQEALEKAREIQLKADEEFAIEKSKLVRQETASIDTGDQQSGDGSLVGCQCMALVVYTNAAIGKCNSAV